MNSQERRAIGELPKFNLFIVPKGTHCYTLFRYLILRDRCVPLKLCFT